MSEVLKNEMYERGKLVEHTSNPGGFPDVGISVGLGNGTMLYAGEIPGPKNRGWSISIYTKMGRIDIASDINNDKQQAVDFIERISGAINQPKNTQ